MSAPAVRPGLLMNLAAEGIVPILGGCAGALAGGPEGGLAGVAVGQVVERAINLFGQRIVGCWCDWFRAQPPEARDAALAELAALSSREAHQEAAAAVERLAPDAAPADRSLAVLYLSAIPRTLDRALLRDSATGARSLPPTASFDEPQLLLQLLPTDVPPYPVPSDLAGTPYRLEELLGSGGFGAVYRATTPSLQHLPLAIKFCHDPALAAALHRERSNLERLMKVGGESWSQRIVRLYGYDLDHATPYLVYEYVAGGDLIHYLARRRQQSGRALNPDEVLGLVVQVAEALAFAHGHGLVHRDLKPANILVDGDTLKLADFGLGGVVAARAVQVSRIGLSTIDYLSVAEQASLFRGAGTPLYMAPEQRRGAGPDPRHDLYSLGVMWYQLLAGDVTRELHPGWAKELALRFGAPQAHINLIERCVGWLDERPRDAGELLPLLRAEQKTAPAALPAVVADPPPAEAAPAVKPSGAGNRLRQAMLVSLVRQLSQGHDELKRLADSKNQGLAGVLWVTLPAAFGLFWCVGSSWLGVLVILLIPVAAVAWVLWLHQSQKNEARRKVEESIRTLTAEFPGAVAAWGGPSVLRNADAVREILGTLNEPGAPLPEVPADVGAKAVVIPAAERERRDQLAEQLRQILQTHEEARRADRKPLSAVVALAVSVLLGLPAGLGVGGLYGWYRLPHYYAGEYFDFDSNTISSSEASLKERKGVAAAAALGVLTGLLVAGAGTWLLTRWRLRHGRFALTVGLCVLLLGVPVGLGIGLLYRQLYSPYYHRGIYYDYRGDALTGQKGVHYEASQWQADLGATVLGVIAGLVLAAAVTVALTWRSHRRQDRARPELLERIKALTAAFPLTVQSWGGEAVLRDRGRVEEILRAMDAGRG